MYFFARVAVNYLVSNKIWLLIKKIDTTSFSIYLFHVVFLYIVLFIDFRWGFRIAALRITLSFIAGLLLSIFVHELITKNKILSQAFAIPYYRQDDILRRFN
jgi:peptidoglycan/LPS O-acetylase OafA/YrhL